MSNAAKIVVLDDDPTGTQTVHGVPVLTEWSIPSLVAELTAGGSCFYILTNSRAFTAPRACAINQEIGRNLLSAGKQCGRSFQVVSRSDSTLRGHYPAETDALAEALGGKFDATLIIPAFFDGGRVTMDDIHYVAGPGGLTPAGETEFARDATFGYRSSNLRDWVEEKTVGRVRASDVVSFSLADIRGEPAPLTAKLASLSGGVVAIVNLAEAADLHAFTRALRDAQAQGKKFLFRTAASFVASHAGISPRPLLTAAEIAPPGVGRGLVVVGSHVGKTSLQLQNLLESKRVSGVEIKVEKLLIPSTRGAEVARAAQRVESLLDQGANVALFTSRALVTGSNAAENLAIGETVSRSLVEIVSSLRNRPRWLVAKGGITSSDVATAALGVRRALILGQALAGVPVWQLGPETRWPGLAYVVFPGNVGGPDALAQLVAMLG
ncbi:MAG: four-carbon acid sugar kinase family protein [Opitutaceae bacterium]